MNNLPTITKDQFLKRLTDLCLRSGLTGFPKDMNDQHILLKSVLLTMGPVGSLTESEVNEKLKFWITEVAQYKWLDHGTLRRRLVDTGYLTRDKGGSVYQVSPGGPSSVAFESEIEDIDVLQAVSAAREEAARRKREYMEKAKRG